MRLRRWSISRNTAAKRRMALENISRAPIEDPLDVLYIQVRSTFGLQLLASGANESCGGGMGSSSQSLCLACGICCEGTIFQKVALSPEDEIFPLTEAGIKIVSDGKLNLFRLPCAAHKNRACTVYE